MLFSNKFDIFEKKILKARVFDTYVYTSSLMGENREFDIDITTQDILHTRSFFEENKNIV